MKKQIILELFEKTTNFKQRRKECISELRDQHTCSFISALDFLKELEDMGFKSNTYGEVKLRMKKAIREKYFNLQSKT